MAVPQRYPRWWHHWHAVTFCLFFQASNFISTDIGTGYANKGKYLCTTDLLFYQFGSDQACKSAVFVLSKIQTRRSAEQWYFPLLAIRYKCVVIYRLMRGMNTSNEFIVPDINFRESDKLFRPTAPIQDASGSSTFVFPATHLMRESAEEIVLLG